MFTRLIGRLLILWVSGCMAQQGEAMGRRTDLNAPCAVWFTNPSSAVPLGSVPRNTAVDIFYHSDHLGVCNKDIRAVNSETQERIPFHLIYHSESTAHIAQHTVLGYVRMRFDRPLASHEPVVVFFHGVPVLHFQTDGQEPFYEGSLLRMRPVLLSLSSCRASSVLSSSDIHQCLQSYLSSVFLAPLRSSHRRHLERVRSQMHYATSDLQALLSRPALKYSVRLYQMIYMTKTPDGVEMPVSALFMQPHLLSASHTNHMPLVIMMNGATMADVYAGLMPTSAQVIGLSLASSGFSVLIPDGLGHGVSLGQTEIHLQPLSSFDINKDAVDALKRGPLKHWMGEMAVLGFNQGAFDAFYFFHYYMRSPGARKHPIKYVFLCQGMYHFDSVLDAFFASKRNRQERGGFPQQHAGDHFLLSYLRSYIIDQERSERLPQGFTHIVFDEEGHLKSDFLEDYEQGAPRILPLKVVAHYSSIPMDGQTYKAPHTMVGVYHYLYDPMISLHNRDYLLEILNHPGNVFENVFTGDCRLSSRLEELVRIYSKMKPALSHHYCTYIAADDFVGLMRSTYISKESHV